MYKRPEETDNHLARSSAALRFPVTRKKCVAPPRLRECKVKPSLPRLKKERRREKYFRKLHGDMHTKCSEELPSRQKYRNRLVTELSVTVTCSRVPFLDPVFVKPRSSTNVLPKSAYSHKIRASTLRSREACNENRSRCQVQRPDALVPMPDLQYHGPPLGGSAVHAEASRGVARFSTFSKRLEFAHATVVRNDARQPKCIQPPAAHSSSTCCESSSSKCQTVQGIGLRKSSR